jgi:hypothetical protein
MISQGTQVFTLRGFSSRPLRFFFANIAVKNITTRNAMISQGTQAVALYVFSSRPLR